MIFLTLSHCNREIRSRHVIPFLLYLFAILLVTLVTRRPRADVVLQTEMFASVKEFMVKGTVEDLNHMVLNIVMFMPLGYLFVQMHPQKLGDPAKVVGVGIMLSSVIETCQLIFRLGNCDISTTATESTSLKMYCTATDRSAAAQTADAMRQKRSMIQNG